MAGRLYVCPVIGAGTEDDSQRPLIADKAGVTAWSACIATAANGKPSFPWSICWVDATSWAQVDADNRCFQLTADALGSAPTNRVKNYLNAGGVMTKVEADGHATLRALADALVRKHYGQSSLAAAFPRSG